jgi:cytoskeletal protein RodZ
MMTEEKQQESVESLGQYLQRQREEKDLSFEEVLNETRIPPKSLKAIEADDYASLPADAFARGFYMLYARYLDLETDAVLKRYDQERTGTHKEQKFAPPSALEKRINNMAAGPSVPSGSTLGIFFVILIAIAAILCYSFSFNPATYISEKLRALQTPPASPTQEETVTPENLINENTPLEKKPNSAYFLSMDFLEDTTITVVIDSGLPVEESYVKGSTHSWYANDTLSLLLPESAEVNLFFEGHQLDLPQPEEGIISLKLP